MLPLVRKFRSKTKNSSFCEMPISNPATPLNPRFLAGSVHMHDPYVGIEVLEGTGGHLMALLGPELGEATDKVVGSERYAGQGDDVDVHACYLCLWHLGDNPP